LDVNVLVSAFIKPEGNSAQILASVDGFAVCLSEAILRDVERVLHYEHIRRKYPVSEERIVAYLHDLRSARGVVAGAYVVRGLVSDPDDDAIIACALEAGADFIVTGDPHLLNLKQYRGIQIVSPRAFLEILDRAKQ
jgi:hypothetical protein